MARALRHFVAPVFAVALLAPVAHASESFPPEVERVLQLSAPPDCTLCHKDDEGGTGTVVKPFGRALMSFNARASSLSSLRAALAKSEEQGTDSDGDGVPDIEELKAGTDPNTFDASEEDGGVTTPAPVADLPPLLETGCAVSFRARDVKTTTAALFVASIALLFRLSKREKDRPRRGSNRCPRAVVKNGSRVFSGTAVGDARSEREEETT